jgi:hypothetical protein
MTVTPYNIILSYEAVKKYLCFGWLCSTVLRQQHLSSSVFKNFSSHSWCEYSVQLCEVIQHRRDIQASAGISANFANTIRKNDLELSKFTTSIFSETVIAQQYPYRSDGRPGKIQEV